MRGEGAAVGSSVEAVFREERGRLLASLVRRSATSTWPRRSLPRPSRRR
ncbi:hypothetical protein JNW90_12905 [Micromonospora sp. STR1s_5]|nr:hypothetical protein [Micromonospora sp. STR1s_5]